MARWIASYIDENSDRWKKEQEERQKVEKKQTEDWLRMNRFVKIKIIRERMEENTVVEMKIRPAVLPTPARTPITLPHSPNYNHSQNVHVDEELSEQCHILPGGSRLDTTLAVPVKKSCKAIRAEQCTTTIEMQNEVPEKDQAEQSPPQRMQHNPMVCEDRADTLSRGQAEHNGSPGSSHTQTIRQSHTSRAR